MSIDALKAAFTLQGVSATDKLVLLALANFADEEWQCWPSKATLEAMTGLSGRAITIAAKRLEEAGYVARESRTRANGSSTSNRYTLCLGPGGEFAAPPQLASPPPRRLVHPGGESGAPPEPPLNPHKEYPQKEARTRPSKFAPDGWKPSESHAVKAAELGLSREQVHTELEKFREFEFRDPKTDWDRTFHRWLREAADRLQRNGHGRGVSPQPNGANRNGPDKLGALLGGAQKTARRWTF